ECAGAEYDDREKAEESEPPPLLAHRSAFQSATVSGKSECPSCSDHSSRVRTTCVKTPSKSCGKCLARKARSRFEKRRPGSRKSAMKSARPVRSHCSDPME